jgi:hypothetical protein
MIVNKRLSDLETSANIESVDKVLISTENGNSKTTSMQSIADFVKKEIGIYDRVLEKCAHCGQWGAVMCACRTCGAPIDPVLPKVDTVKLSHAVRKALSIL